MHPNEITGWLRDPERREFRHRLAADGGPEVVAYVEGNGVHVWLDVPHRAYAGTFVRVDTKAEADNLLERLYPVPEPAPEPSPYHIVRICDRVTAAFHARLAADAEYDAARAEASEWFRERDDDTSDE